MSSLTEHEPHGSHQTRKATASGWIGSALEYYDFFIYATAASLIFPQVFFPKTDPTVAIIASLATYGVGYVARPIGAFVLGHWGDTHGRKTVLIVCMFLMGFSTVAVGRQVVLNTHAIADTINDFFVVLFAGSQETLVVDAEFLQTRHNGAQMLVHFESVEKRFHKQFVVTAGRHRAANHSQNAPPFSCRWTEHVCRNNAHVIGPKSFSWYRATSLLIHMSFV